jgi:hypothetical protein
MPARRRATSRNAYHLPLLLGSSGILADPIRLDGPFRAVAVSGTVPTNERVAILLQTQASVAINAFAPSTVVVMSGDTWPTGLQIHSVFVPQFNGVAGCVASLVEEDQP